MAPTAVKRKSHDNHADGSRPAKRSAAHKSRSRDSRALKRNTETEEIKELERATQEFVPPKEYGRFDHLPLSTKTRQGESIHIKKAHLESRANDSIVLFPQVSKKPHTFK